LGTELQKKYRADIKDQIGKAVDDEEVRNLANYLIEKGLSVKNLLPSASNTKVEVIPRDQFERGLRNIGFVPSIPQEKFSDYLMDKKDPKLINLEPIKKRIKKVGIKKPEHAAAITENMP
jgi:hypothetical protein